MSPNTLLQYSTRPKSFCKSGTKKLFSECRQYRHSNMIRSIFRSLRRILRLLRFKRIPPVSCKFLLFFQPPMVIPSGRVRRCVIQKCLRLVKTDFDFHRRGCGIVVSAKNPTHSKSAETTYCTWNRTCFSQNFI